ncbi:MAG: hypothetical protein SGI87_10335 [Flavobacteriales bacterium]|nr:hypothetical protein [Flavobacteriales bacterium]
MKRKHLPVLILFAIIGTLTLFTSCESNDAGKNPPGMDTTAKADDPRLNSIKKILYSIPAPMQMASLIKESGSTYDKTLLNNTENAKVYNGEVKQAINLGVYGADLSYSSIFDRKQESMNFLAAAQKLSRELGVDGALKDDIVDRMNSNMENRDSLLNIVSQAYADLYDYLKENKREHISALVISGGWIEGLYLGTLHCKNSADLKQRIAEQKYALRDLLSLVNQYTEFPQLSGVRADLEEMQALFNEVQETKGGAETSKDENGMVVIGGSAGVSMSEETLAKVSTKVKELRTKYIAQ